jgi:S-adenosylmethionine decarboxylase proenzyme
MYDCDEKFLSDVNYIQNAMNEPARQAKTTVIDSIFHSFKPFGVSGVVVIAESHLAIHTWPEHNFASLDFFTCGSSSNPWKAFEVMKKKLKAKHFSVIKMKRGLLIK